MQPLWSVSIVSHGHGERVLSSLVSIDRCLANRPREIFLTLNTPEQCDFLKALPPATRQRIRLLRNERPLGFGANHNRALNRARGKYFLIADPELSIMDEDLFQRLEQDLALPGAGIVAPLAMTPEGAYDYNGRPLVTPLSLVRKYLFHRSTQSGTAPSRVDIDWLAGLLMAMPADVFRTAEGFDEGYFMYCEDVDLCLRVQQKGYWVRLLHDVQITHHAARNTRKSLRHLYWHVASLLRLWRSKAYRASVR